MKKVIVILGQTATGKSALAVEIAKKLNGEIISADSRQVYTGLDIGTGKITKEEMGGIPHHLLSIFDPAQKFSVEDFTRLTISSIAEIVKRDRLPIICGGTGFYIDSLVNGSTYPKVEPDFDLRKTLETMSTESLLKMLTELDQDRAKNIDHKNKVRLVRAIEIATALGKVPAIQKTPTEYEFIKIGLTLPIQELSENINKRVAKMFDDGLLLEIGNLKRSGITDERLSEFGFEYDNPTQESVINETIKYAKRQMTWFKRDDKIKWFKPIEMKEIQEYIQEKLS